MLRRVLRAPIQRAAALAAVLSLTAGCGIGPDTCSRPESDEPTLYCGGAVSGHTYSSSEWNKDLLHFPGGAYYNIHHRLGSRPDGVSFYLSFERDGLADASVAPAAGNQVEMKHVDDRSITVVNGSCAEYWLVAVAWTSPCATQCCDPNEHENICEVGEQTSSFYGWNGVACVEMTHCGPCEPEGSGLARTLSECEERYASCAAP